MLKGPRHAVFFSGDTGYAGHFSEVRERLGAPELALIKIGAYGATWLDIHMDPEIRRARAPRPGCGHAAARALGHVQPGGSRLGGARPAQRGGRACAGRDRSSRPGPARSSRPACPSLNQARVPEAVLRCLRTVTSWPRRQGTHPAPRTHRAIRNCASSLRLRSTRTRVLPGTGEPSWH